KEQGEERAGQQQGHERPQRHLAEQERPVVRVDLVEQGGAQRRRGDLEPFVHRVARRGGQVAQGALAPGQAVGVHSGHVYRSQNDGPTGTLKSELATKKPSSSSSIGSMGSARAAGPKIGRAFSVMRNCDW